MYGIELFNNIGVAFIQQLLHMIRSYNLMGTRGNPLEAMFLYFLCEAHVKFLEIDGYGSQSV